MDSVDEYINNFPTGVQKALTQIRAIIKKNAPLAIESISYGMPAYKTNGKPLVYFAGFKNHIGFYATPTGHETFADELSKYKQGKGSVQFPLDQPMPSDLIGRIVAFRVKENEDRANKSKQLKTCKNGHQYYKTSDCPTCPVCERERLAKESAFTGLSSPARRALENNGIITLEQLSQLTVHEILNFHGIGKSSIPRLTNLLNQQGLAFRK